MAAGAETDSGDDETGSGNCGAPFICLPACILQGEFLRCTVCISCSTQHPVSHPPSGPGRNPRYMGVVQFIGHAVHEWVRDRET
ncbi:uncharacterized protein PGTG_18616 [Puccinia graminis f. sp. tritici CRL 75-36-700-3]|uniref:Uncharacterized protein n=1 Tax=Puccinia graminis f. sp. tritici (strain CRL 75-36-700-3 / race SCCL) TaxID=418459 RepID=E3L7U2_PUCGT|nr:uncharacterized protein PGTG_18616 [Puccinia graminis f. sp. tritici CRL 75-36-700-3]EFP92617.1 hypothetical protein PGTG_18616 [Puccinia graminis f. sp. tritici CRL 75-36-700-3]